MEISFVLNDEKVSLNTNPVRRLLDVLREDFGLRGVKEGCGEGECGACAVLVNGRLINSCLVPLVAVQDGNVVTIEGYRTTKRFTALSEAFVEAGAVQCGFCTPGMIMASEALLQSSASPSRHEIRSALSGNLCRCTGMNMIIDAVERAAERGRGLW